MRALCLLFKDNSCIRMIKGSAYKVSISSHLSQQQLWVKWMTNNTLLVKHISLGRCYKHSWLFYCERLLVTKTVIFEPTYIMKFGTWDSIRPEMKHKLKILKARQKLIAVFVSI
jgi:hypothetical protein